MPHATCCFLIGTAELVGDSSLDLLASPDGDFLPHVERVFDPWRRHVCHPPGLYWYTHEGLMLHNGRVVQLVSEGDWRGRDNIIHEWRNDDTAVDTLTSMTNDDPWAWLQKVFLYAMRCAANGVNANLQYIAGHEDIDENGMSLPELVEWFRRTLPEEISQCYHIESELDSFEHDPVGERYRLAVVQAYEAFMHSTTHPFTHGFRKPELYRCFDLRGDPHADDGTESMCVLLADIHTP